MRSYVRGIAILFWVTAALAGPMTATTWGASNCPAANPNDAVADSAALQACINGGGTITLDPGTPGYIIDQGLVVVQNNTTLITSNQPQLATLLAHPDLSQAMLRAASLSNVSVRFLHFDGNRPNRTNIATKCTGDRHPSSNLYFSGTTNAHIDSGKYTRTLCGSAVNVGGVDFDVSWNWIEDNGHGTEDQDATDPWADGITLNWCDGGRVHHNTVSDSTDVGIVSLGGPNCRIDNNNVAQSNRHAFAGISLGGVHGQELPHKNSVVEDNTIVGSGKLSFGIAFGMHPWDGTAWVKGGWIKTNYISGAIVNLLVDGVRSVPTNVARVDAQNFGAPAGIPVCQVGYANANYGRHLQHTSGVVTVGGWVERDYHACLP